MDEECLTIFRAPLEINQILLSQGWHWQISGRLYMLVVCLSCLFVFAMLATPAQDSWDILEGLAAGIPGATCPRYDTRWEGISNPCRHHTEAIQFSWPKQPLGPSVQEVLSVKWLKQNGVKCSKLGVCRPSRLYKGETPRRRSVLETCAGLMPYRQVGESFARALGWQKSVPKRNGSNEQLSGGSNPSEKMIVNWHPPK